MPTVEQAFTCVRVCQMLSNGFQPIHVFILAGETESLEILIFPDGQWKFNDYET